MDPIRQQQAADSSANNPRGDSYEYKDSPAFDDDVRWQLRSVNLKVSND